MMNNSQPLRVLVPLLVAMGLWLVAGGVARAAQITYCDAFPDTGASDCRSDQLSPTNWNGNLTLRQFNPISGTLNAVQILVDGAVRGNVQYENTGPNAALISATHAVTILLTLPNADTVSNTPSTTRVELAPPFDGVLDFGGPSGRTFAISNTESLSLTLTSASDLAPFIGLGTVSVPATARGISFIRGPGNLSALLQAQAASVVVAVTYFYTAPGIDLEKYTNGRDADGPDDPDVPQIAPGDTVIWTYHVRNTGSTPFAEAEVNVLDDQPGVNPQLDRTSDLNADSILSPNETWVYTATLPAQNLLTPTTGTRVVDGCDPSNSGNTRPTYSNIGTVVVNTLSDVDPSHYCNPAPGIDIKKFTNGADADGPDDPDVPQISPGATVTWTYLVTNTGTISYAEASVVIADSQPGVTPLLVDNGDGDGFLAPGEVWRYQAIALAQDLSSTTSGTVVVPGCDPADTGLTRRTYRNIGTVTVDTLTDFDPSHYCNPPTPGIDIEKLVNGNDADDPNGPDVPQLTPGDTVNWIYQVRNTGNISFTRASVVVIDSQSGVTPVLDPLSDVGNDEILSAGETWIYRASAVVQTLETPTVGTVIVDGCNPGGAATPGQRATYQNIGQVTVPGDDDQDPAHYCNPPAPGIAIRKFTNGADADDGNGLDVPTLTPGTVVTWTYLVTNTGNIAFALDEVTLTDSHPGVTPVFDSSSDDGDQVLSPGESWRYLATGIVQDLTAPEPDTITVFGCNPDNNPQPGNYVAYRNLGRVQVPGAQDTNPAHYCNPPDDGQVEPGITIKKFTNGADADDPNGLDVPILAQNAVVTWTYRVTNTGNITFALDQLSVTDDQTGVTPVFDPTSDDGDGLLSPGEHWIYLATGLALDLTEATTVTIVSGCTRAPDNTPRNTYANIGTVTVGDLVATDPSHYCNPPPTAIDEEEEPQVNKQEPLFLPLISGR